jgi:hypothetical protein
MEIIAIVFIVVVNVYVIRDIRKNGIKYDN